MFRLSTSDQKKIKHLTHANRMPRKNLLHIINIVNSWHDGKNKTITSKEAEKVVDELGLRNQWDLKDTAKDKMGLRKAIGDLLGGLGLKLPHDGRCGSGFKFAIPPNGIDDAYLKSIGLDLNDIEEQVLVPEIIEAIRNKQIITFRYEGDPDQSQPRRFCPHIYYRKNTMPMVGGIQISGYSSSGLRTKSTKWRIFQSSKISDLNITTKSFNINSIYKPNSYRTPDYKIYAEIDDHTVSQELPEDGVATNDQVLT